MKKILFLFCLFLLVIPYNIKAQKFDIMQYEFKAKISKNIEIEEKYDIYVHEPLEKFIRILPYTQQLKNEQKNSYQSYIKNVKVDKLKYIAYPERDKKTIIINSNFNINDNPSLTIKYKRDIEKSTKNKDEIFFYLVDGTIGNKISNIHFDIQLPTSVSRNDITFYIDGEPTNHLYYQISNNKITGNYNIELEPNQTFALSISFPKGTIKEPIINPTFIYYGLPIFPLLGLLYGFYVWLRYQRKNKVKKIEDALPPEHFDSAELAYLYRGYTKKSDIISLFIILMNQGCIQMIRTEAGTFIEKKHFYMGKNALQNAIINGLFRDRNKVNTKDIIEFLENNQKELISILDNNENKKLIFEKRYKRVSIIYKLLILLSALYIIIFPTYRIFDIIAIPIFLSILFFLGVIIGIIQRKKIILNIMGIIILLIPIVIECYYLSTNIIYLSIFLVTILIICMDASILRNLPKRTRYGNQMYGKIIGFRNTLRNTSITKLKEIQDVNPHYFYQMIPYTYIFGFYDKWIMNGYQVIPKLPSWYQDEDYNSLKSFRQAVQTFLLSLEENWKE